MDESRDGKGSRRPVQRSWAYPTRAPSAINRSRTRRRRIDPNGDSLTDDKRNEEGCAWSATGPATGYATRLDIASTRRCKLRAPCRSNSQTGVCDGRLPVLSEGQRKRAARNHLQQCHPDHTLAEANRLRYRLDEVKRVYGQRLQQVSERLPLKKGYQRNGHVLMEWYPARNLRALPPHPAHPRPLGPCHAQRARPRGLARSAQEGGCSTKARDAQNHLRLVGLHGGRPTDFGGGLDRVGRR